MPKTLTVALTGNPNVGKTALFNNLTGARQHVANWPGVTVEKKKAGSIWTITRLPSSTCPAPTVSAPIPWKKSSPGTLSWMKSRMW